MKGTRLAFLCASAGLTRHSLAQSSRQCYYPNGDVVLADHPCDPDAEHSPCCGSPPQGGVCLSNMLCKGTNGIISRGSCTDPTWQSPACASFCLNLSIDGGWVLNSCSNITENDSYCCSQGGPDCCASDDLRMTLGQEPAFTWARFVASSTGYYTIATPLSTSSFSSRTSSTSSVRSASSTPSAPEEAPTATSGTASSGTPPATETAGGQTARPSSQTSGGSTGLSAGAKAGIGVGAAAGALLLAVIVYLAWKLHQRNRALEEILRDQQAATDADARWPPAYPGHTSQAIPMNVRPKWEMPADQAAHEMPVPSPLELPGRNPY